MVFNRGITYWGLVPSYGPLFFGDLKEEFLAQGGKLGKRGGYTGKLFLFSIFISFPSPM